MPALLSLQPGPRRPTPPYRRQLDGLIRERAGGAGSRDRSEPVSGAGAVRINRKRAVEAAAAAEEETEGLFRGKWWKDPGGPRGETQLRRERRGIAFRFSGTRACDLAESPLRSPARVGGGGSGGGG